MNRILRDGFGHKPECEKGGGVSLTIPDQSMTVSEILKRFARGLPINGDSFPIYDGGDEEDDLPDISRMDLSEIAELKEYAKNNIDSLKKRLKDDSDKGKAGADAPPVPDGADK